MSYRGILGLNARSLLYMRPYNKRGPTKLVDSKVDTKNLLIENNIPTPKMYGVIESLSAFENFNFNKLPQSFVIKPNRGFGGGGILVLKGSERKEDFLKKKITDRVWIGPNDKQYAFTDFKDHILDILFGRFSLSNDPDIVLIEKKIVVDKQLLELCGKGVPDIRVIVFNSVPVMAMLRLPTQKSDGRANLATGGIGVGIDVATGETTTAYIEVPFGRMLEEHPDTGKELLGFYMPSWDKVLEVAVSAQRVSGLGYAGVDIVLDRRDGPVILELNARPGLGIQSTNLDGLRKRLDRLKGLKIKSVSKGVRIGKELFGGDIERRVEDMTGRDVIGLVESVVFYSKTGRKRVEEKAKIDTGARMTSIDKALAKKLGYKDAVSILDTYDLSKKGTSKDELERYAQEIEEKEDLKSMGVKKLKVVKSSSGFTLRPVVEMVYVLSGQEIVTEANIADRSAMLYKALIGKVDMEHFLIDPTMRSNWEEEVK
jgi:alpha-L-glutamate ligase-like protein